MADGGVYIEKGLGFDFPYEAIASITSIEGNIVDAVYMYVLSSETIPNADSCSADVYIRRAKDFGLRYEFEIGLALKRKNRESDYF